MPLDHRDPHQVARRIGGLVAVHDGDVLVQVLGQDLAGQDADHVGRRPVAAVAEARGGDGRRLDRLAADRRERRPRGKGRVVHHTAPGDHKRRAAICEVRQRHDVGPPSGRHQPTVAQTERERGRQGCRAVDGQHWRAQRDQRADHVVEMAVLGDVQRVAIVGAQAHAERGEVGQQRLQRHHVLGHRPLADQDLHPPLQLLARFLDACCLVFRADARGDIGVQVPARQQRRVAVDVPALEQRELFHRGGVAMNHAGIIHELGQTDARRVAAQPRDVGRRQLGPGGFHVGGGHAGRQLHPQVHQQPLGRALEPAHPLGPQHVGDLVRIADRGGDPARGHAAVELDGRDQAAFDVQVRVDEARHQRQAGHIAYPRRVVGGPDAHDGVTHDRHIARDHGAGDQIEHLPAAKDQIGGHVPAPRRDPPFQSGHGLSSLR